MSYILLRSVTGFGQRSGRPPCLWTRALFFVLLWLVCSVHGQECPAKCNCSGGEGEMVVDCSSRGLTYVPNFYNISADILQLDLSNNSIRAVMQQDFTNLTNLIQLDLRRNRISFVENATFARSNLFSLQLLHLGHNWLRGLPDDVFTSLELTVLDLSYNYFSAPPRGLANAQTILDLRLNNNPLGRLELSAFNDTHGISTLELSSCGLTTATLHPLALRQEIFLSLDTLYLDNNFFPELNYTFFMHYTRSMQNLYLQNCSISKMGRRTFRRISSLKRLYLRGNNFTKLERLIFHELNLDYLDLSHCNIENIQRGAFRTVIRDTLYLDHNNITVIHNRDFLDLNRLQHLKLSYSNISVIQGKPFDALQDLSELYLDHNQLTDEQLSANLTGPPTLHFLDLTSNQLDRFPNVSRSRFPILTSLLISQNNIRSLHRQEMGNLSHLRQLFIKNNYIEEIDNDAFACCPNLTVLDLAFSRLTQLPDMSHLPRLVNLHVPDSELEFLPDLCTTNPLLLILEVDRNKIRSIPSFSQCSDIFSIVLADNQITELTNGTFAGLQRLEVLDLGRNRIGGLPHGVFSGLHNLKFLYLQGNQIWELPADTFSNCSHLTRLDLSYNQIRRLEQYIFRYNVKVDDLLLNNNFISYIAYEAFPANMTDLKLLNLSNNFELRSWRLPPGGFPNLRVIALEQMFFLHQVPNQNEIPLIQEMYYTYAYHCCIWYDNVIESLKQPAPMGVNVTEPPTIIPTDPIITLPPHLDLIDQDDPFLLDCKNRGEISDEHIQHLIEFQRAYNATVTILPNCAIEFDFHGQDSQTVEVVGTSQNEFFENANVLLAENLNREVSPWKPELQCFPRPNPLTPCENLMDPWVLRVAIWAIWVLALLGNVTVLFVMIAAREKVDVPQILICSLAFADFCIGVYLAFLAVVDVRTYGERSFYQSALDWQLGPGCQTAGFIAVFATELSVYSLVALTLERVHTIAYAFNHNHRVRKRVAILVVVFGLLLAAVVAALPLFGINSYSKVAVCLPFVTEQLEDRIYIGFIISINLIGFLIILTSYIYIFCRIRKSPAADQNRHEIFSATGKIALLILATFVCWVPLAVIGYSALADMPLVTAGQAKFFLVFVYPINACVNPFIYAIFTRQFRERMMSMVKNTKKEVQSFPPAHPLRIQRAQSANIENTMDRVNSPKSTSPECLMKLRQSRRSNSFSVQLVDTNMMLQSPTPPTPRGVVMGRRSSLPAVFGSTVHSVHSDSNNTHGNPTYQLPFRLGPLYSSSNNGSLPNLQEENEESEDTAATAAREVRPTLNGSQASNESMMKRLSVVLEGDEEDIPERDQSVSESESEYSDAHESLQGHHLTVISSRVERSTDLDATTAAAVAVADSYSCGVLYSPGPSPNSLCSDLTGSKTVHSTNDSCVETSHVLDSSPTHASHQTNSSVFSRQRLFSEDSLRSSSASVQAHTKNSKCDILSRSFNTQHCSTSRNNYSSPTIRVENPNFSLDTETEV